METAFCFKSIVKRKLSFSNCNRTSVNCIILVLDR